MYLDVSLDVSLAIHLPAPAYLLACLPTLLFTSPLSYHLCTCLIVSQCISFRAQPFCCSDLCHNWLNWLSLQTYHICKRCSRMGGKQGEHEGTLSGRNGKGEGLAGRKGRRGGTGREDRKGSWEEWMERWEERTGSWKD